MEDPSIVIIFVALWVAIATKNKKAMAWLAVLAAVVFVLLSLES